MATVLEPKLHDRSGGVFAETSPPVRPERRMTKDFQLRFSAVILGLVTITAIIFAVFNFKKEQEYKVPYDGVWWVEHDGWLRADRVVAGSPGEKAGIKRGDELVAINNRT
ncbi:MAG: hypothetical protein JOY79_02080, partial [Acidobacteriaceae bacterium]|nr:hypothetical protein [Acidobacteriaceae bacterium]